jgi:hypothetical protein
MPRSIPRSVKPRCRSRTVNHALATFMHMRIRNGGGRPHRVWHPPPLPFLHQAIELARLRLPMEKYTGAGNGR